MLGSLVSGSSVLTVVILLSSALCAVPLSQCLIISSESFPGLVPLVINSPVLAELC